MILPPAAAAAVRGRELAGGLVGGPRVDGQEVPVERTTSRRGHGHHQVDLVVAEGVEAAVGDVFERGPRMIADHLAERQHLPAVGVTGGDRVAVTVGVGPGLRRREPEAAGLDRLGQQRAHGGQLLVVRHLAGPLCAHHPAADGAVADQEAGVDAQIALEPSEVLAEGGPVPVDPVFEGDQRHAFDLGHHPADVVVVLLLDRGEGESAVSGDHRGDAVQVGRGRRRVPEQLGVVVGVGVDDPGGDDESGGIELGGPGLLHGADGDDHPVLDPDIGQEAGGAGAVDDGAVADHVVEHGGVPSVWPRRGPVAVCAWTRRRADGGRRGRLRPRVLN